MASNSLPRCRSPSVRLARSAIGCSVAVAALALTTGCGGGKTSELAPRDINGLTLPARVQGRSIEAATKNGFVPTFWAGVNLGSTIPGRQPGEVAATRRDYDRWLSGIGDLGARVIRIYTILRPPFARHRALRSARA